jgi:peptidoglycan/xylan/chitin deacetylase (PgdA/CDA1 family)
MVALDKVYVALTFDDGYLVHYHIAKYLYKEGIKATFFVITHLKIFEDKPLLTMYPELLQEISDMGHEVGSHSCSHSVLTDLPLWRLEREIIESKRWLEEMLTRSVEGFAYPGGFYNKNVVLAVAKHYKYARLAGKRFEAKTWNAHKHSRYLIEGIGYRELLKMPLKRVIYYNIKPVIVFHDDPLYKVKAVIAYLKLWRVEFTTLRELANNMMI